MNKSFVFIALLLSCAAPRIASADPLDGLAVLWDFNPGALDQDFTANDRDLTFRANPNAYGGAGALPTIAGGGVGGGTALGMPASVHDTRMGAPGTFFGDIFGPDPFAGGDAYRADEGPGVGVFDLNNPTGFAFQAWVNFNALPGDRYQTLLSKSTDLATASWQGWNLSMYRSGNGTSLIEFAAKTSHGAPPSLLSAVSLTTGAWYHVLVNASVTGPNMQYDLHINNALVASQSNGLVNSVAEPLLLGHSSRSYGGVPDLWSGSLLGSLDQVAFWNRTLTSEDIDDLYNGGQGLSFASPVPDHASSLVLTGFALAVLVGLGPRLRKAI